MSIISDAFLDSLMEQGMPVVIIPMRKKKKTLSESFEVGSRLNSIRMDKPGSVGVIPSPVPG